MNNSTDNVHRTTGGAMDSKSQSADNAAVEELPPAMPTIRVLNSDAPISWLKKGYRDMVDTRFKGCFYGVIFMLMGYVIAWIYATQWQLTMGLIGGFFLMGPFLCTGIYDLSRQLKHGGSTSLLSSMTCWTRNLGSIAFFAIILTFIMIVWARVSVILFALASTTSFPTLQGVLASIFSFENTPFVALWLTVGLGFASIAFSIGVIAVPMMLDRKSDTFTAIFSSVRSVFANPSVVLVWAVLVVIVIGLSLVLGFIPLILTAPLVGHATWHAYQDLVQQEPEV